MEAQLLPVCPTCCPIEFSPYYTPPRDWSTRLGSTIMWPPLVTSSREKRTLWQCSLFAASMVLHHRTNLPSSLVWGTQILNGDFDHQTRQRLSIRDRSTQGLRFPSQRHESGIVGHLSSRRIHRCQYWKGDWRQNFSHARTLPPNAKHWKPFLTVLRQICVQHCCFFITRSWISSELYVSLIIISLSIIYPMCIVEYSSILCF